MPSGQDRLPATAHLGVLPVVPADTEPPQGRSNAATAASAAGIRAITAQTIAFYFRAPVKAFFRTRVDYLAYARTVHEARAQAFSRSVADGSAGGRSGSTRLNPFWGQMWMWARGTTPGLLTSVVQQHGWRVVPEQIIPPLIANVSVGAVLYTSYLHILGRLHEESSRSTKRAYPPPTPGQTFTAGLLAGGLQSLVAAPLDAIQARFDHRDLLAGVEKNGRPRSMWSFGAEKLREIGVRGVFAGWGLSFVKDSLGSAVFFSTFEYIKAQSYYQFVTWYYGGLREEMVDTLARKRPRDVAAAGGEGGEGGPTVIRPHYAIEPMFLLLAGMGGSFAQQVILHPLTHVQVKHWDHLEDLDAKADRLRASRAAPAPAPAPASARSPAPERPLRRWRMLRAYYRAYRETWANCGAEASAEGRGVLAHLYRGFWWNTIRQVPSTSAGLIIFELVRRKYGMGDEEVRITRENYDILLH